MIVIDTSVLVDALCGPRRSMAALIATIDRGEHLALCTMVLYEWRRGIRSPAEIAIQETLLPIAKAFPFTCDDAFIAADIYRAARRARSREADLAIAACAIRHSASLWTLNTKDFADIPGLQLYSPKT